MSPTHLDRSALAFDPDEEVDASELPSNELPPGAPEEGTPEHPEGAPVVAPGQRQPTDGPSRGDDNLAQTEDEPTLTTQTGAEPSDETAAQDPESATARQSRRRTAS